MKKITLLFLLFLSFSAFAQFPESFETAVPPTGWTTFRGTNGIGTTQDWTATTLAADVSEGAQAAFVRWENVDGGLAEDWLVSPLHTVTAPNTSLSFFQRQSFAIDYGSEYTIRVSTTSQTNIASFTIVNTQTEADLSLTMTEKLVDLSAYVGQSIYIAFVMTNDDGDNWAIDNVNMVSSISVPNCATVLTPADNAVDVPIGVVPFSWEAPTTGDAPTAYDFFYGIAPDQVDILLGTYTTTTVDVTLNDYGFTFYWKIVPKNAAGSAVDCPVWTFTTVESQGFCLNAPLGQFPGGEPYTATDCDGVTSNVITLFGYAGEYSLVNVTEGETYVFTSGTSDFITISTDDGVTAATFGESPLTWVSNHSGVIRFYSHLSDQCEAEEEDRERSFVCGVLSSDVPQYANLQFPFDATILQGETVTVYGQVYVAGLTDVEPNIEGQAPGIQAWVGVSPIGENTNPNTWTTWIPATWNSGHLSNNDEYQANIGTGLLPGTYYYATRFRLNDGPFVYGGTNFGFWDGTTYLSGVLTVTPPPAPGNDECANATPLTPGAVFEDNSLTSTNAAATANAANPLPSCGAFNFATNGKDVWFSVVVPDSGTLTIETQGNGGLTDSALEVYSGSCDALVAIDCNDDVNFPANPYSRVELEGLTAGQTLLVRVWGYNGAEGSFVVSAFDASLSTGSFDNAGFKYYPNPVKDILNLSYTSSISNVSVINLLGQQVLTKNVNANESQLDLSSLTTGTYLVKVTTEDNLEKTIKIVKQ